MRFLPPEMSTHTRRILMLLLLIMLAHQRAVSQDASDLLLLESENLIGAANNYYQRTGVNRWASRNIALDMLRCEQACGDRNMSGNMSDSSHSCPSAHLMDYLVRGAYGRGCDAKPVYKTVSRAACHHPGSVRGTWACKSEAPYLCRPNHRKAWWKSRFSLRYINSPASIPSSRLLKCMAGECAVHENCY